MIVESYGVDRVHANMFEVLSSLDLLGHDSLAVFKRPAIPLTSFREGIYDKISSAARPDISTKNRIAVVFLGNQVLGALRGSQKRLRAIQVPAKLGFEQIRMRRIQAIQRVTD